MQTTQGGHRHAKDLTMMGKGCGRGHMGNSVSNDQLVLIIISFLLFIFVWPVNGNLKENPGYNYYNIILKNDADYISLSLAGPVIVCNDVATESQQIL